MEMKIAEKGGMKGCLVSFFESRQQILWSAFVIFIGIVAVYSASVALIHHNGAKGIAALDIIEHDLIEGMSDDTKGDSASGNSYDKLYNETLGKLESCVKKSGITGRRASILKGEILFLMKDYVGAAESYKSAYKKGRKSYDGYLALFNAGIAYEEANKLEEALECYRITGEAKDFEFSNHALFSCGRLLEGAGKSSEALIAYQKLADRGLNNAWGKLAKSRLLSLSS